MSLQRAASIWWRVLHRWLLMAVTLERLSLAEGIVLAKTWRPTVRRQEFGGGGGGAPPAPADSVEVEVVVVVVGMMKKP